MNGIVLYKSRYGATQQYADWIAETLRLPVIDPERFDDRILAVCDFLLIGSSVYFGQLLIKDWLKKNEQYLKGKKLFLFIVYAPSPDGDKQDQIIQDNIPDAVRAAADIVFLPGRWITQTIFLMDGVKKENIEGLLMAVRSFVSRTA